jgi:mannose/cellobiose epimerase-like protein (N-acyl-D-glucosamine 2-epimerase family)
MRRKDRALFNLAAERFRRHLEVAWDDVYGGLFRAVNVHGAYTFDKVLWLQEEALVGCLILSEHAGLDWAGEWFARVFDYVEEHFSLQQYGYPLYLYSGDRKVSYAEHVGRKEHYHHPRCVMRNLLGLERMIEREGAVSDFWGEGGRG